MPRSITYLRRLIEPGRLHLFSSHQIIPLGNLPLQSWKDERNIVKHLRSHQVNRLSKLPAPTHCVALALKIIFFSM